MDIFFSVIVLDSHHVVGLKVRVCDINKVAKVVLGQVDQVLVDGLNVPGTRVSEREGPRTDGALVRLCSCVGLPVTSKI